MSINNKKNDSKQDIDRIDCDIVALFLWAVAKTNKECDIPTCGLGEDHFGKYVTLNQYWDYMNGDMIKQLKKCGWTNDELTKMIQVAESPQDENSGEIRFYIDPMRKEHRKAYETAKTLIGRERFKKDMWVLAAAAAPVLIADGAKREKEGEASRNRVKTAAGTVEHWSGVADAGVVAVAKGSEVPVWVAKQVTTHAIVPDMGGYFNDPKTLGDKIYTHVTGKKPPERPQPSAKR